VPATEPEQLHRLFEQAVNAGDLEALMGLYEPDAALIPQPGVTVEGRAVYAMRFVGSSTVRVRSASTRGST
jgi:ketosteroid isomerase-like protein